MEPSDMPKQTPKVWVLTDPVVGHASQSLGVAEALGLPFETRALSYGPLARLPGLLGPRLLCGLDAASRATLAAPWPDVVIATGRRLGGVARWIKRRAAADGKRVVLAQMMDPQAARHDFDLIAAPEHDRLAPHGNIIATLGAPTRVTPERLAAAGEVWRARLAHLPHPRIALLVGGSAGRRSFTPAQAAELGRHASALAQGGSLMVTTSRRTDDAAADALVNAITVPAYVHRWSQPGKQGAGENPYYALLGLCDGVIVTGESVSMASEAVAAAKPLFIYAPAALIKPAFAGFHAALYAQGLAQPLTDSAAFDKSAKAGLRTAAVIADAIRQRLNSPQ
jgi:mitochondrial fission protein ELM1